MAVVKKSFLSNLLGPDTYDTLNNYAKKIVPICTGFYIILFTLTFFVYWDFISTLLNYVTGTSLLFVVYIGLIIILLNFEVNVEEPERQYYRNEPVKLKNTRNYNYTKVWGVMLIILGITTIYLSDRYIKLYSFKCSTFLVDENAGIYHLDYDNDCEYAKESENLVRMKGYEIEEFTNCTLCKSCEEWAEDAETEYESNYFFRR